MNIFVTSHSPWQSAFEQPDKLLVKMVLETAQLLSTAHRAIDGDTWADSLGLYKATHTNHPCAIWARETAGNYEWLADHLEALCQEYTRRFDRIHKTQSSELMHTLQTFLPHDIADRPVSPMPACMPEEFKQAADVGQTYPVWSYRQYLSHGKSYIRDRSAWARRADGVPFWFSECRQEI